MYTFSEYTGEQLPFELPFPQSNLYRSLQESQGFKVLPFVIQKKENVVGFFQAIIYPLAQNKTSIYIPYGPVLTESSVDLLDELSVFLKTLGTQENAIFVRVDFSRTEPGTYPKQYRQIPRYAYKTVYHQPRGELILDISPSEEDLLASMHKKTRYNINKSLKQDLDTTFYSGKDISGWVDTFIALNEQNTKDHKTTTHSKKYFKEIFKLASEENSNFISVTRKEGHVLAINIFIRNGDSVFCPFGASNDLGKKLGAYYHIKWSSILYMKKGNVSAFNWGGVTVGMHDEYLSGVTKFKTGFGGVSVKHPYLHDLIISPLWYKIYMLRKFIKK